MQKPSEPIGNPFDLRNDVAYRHWREQKLDGYPTKAEELVVEVGNPQKLSSAEHNEISKRCLKTNMAVYVGHTGNDPDKDIAKKLGAQFGLHELDHNRG